MKIEADKYDGQTVYIVLRAGEYLSPAAIERALKYARKRERPFVEVYEGEQFKRLMLAEPEGDRG